VIGYGAYVPTNIVTNADLAHQLNTGDKWIHARTGIRERRIAVPGEKTSDLAVEAAHAAISDAGVAVDDIDLIVCATTTPDETFPSVATVIQSRLGMTRGAAFDVQAACSGFIYALAVADTFITAGQVRTVLVVGAETMSRLLDWNDRSTCVLFGDGAGALLLSANDGAGTAVDRGVLNTCLFSDGRLHDLLYVDGGPSTTGESGYLRMQGSDVFRHTVAKISAAIEASAEAAGVTLEEIDWFVPHQANQRILDGLAKKFQIDPAKMISTVALHGNTSAALAPLALATAVDDGLIKRGDLILIEAMGSGLTWGAALVRW
jgi:3-oxoacyl-[acyl-carrier-protein] synthase-3